MVTVESVETGMFLDVDNAKITYIKQVADIGDVTQLNTSYSWTMKFPKTPNNSMIFDSLGVRNSTSDTPYRKRYFNVYENGIVIVRKGLLSVKETADDYKAYIQDGIIDFIKSLSNDNIGEVIDLSEIDHVNDVSTIIASFYRTDYRYIVANYNGIPLPNDGAITNLSPSALVASINCKYLFDKIFAHYGWTYTGDVDIENLWMTYPNSTAYDTVSNEVLGLTSLNVRANNYMVTDNLLYQSVPFVFKDFFEGRFEYVVGSQDCAYRCLSTGYYKIIFNIQGYANQWKRGTFEIANLYFRAALYINNVEVLVNVNLSENLEEASFITTLNIGDVIKIHIYPLSFDFRFVEFAYITETNMSIYLLGVSDISFSSALIKYSVKDFFKEMMIRGALTSFADIDTKNIDFINLDNRIDAPVVDFSEKYIRRKKESYLYESYAQHNLLKHKYDLEGDSYDDGDLKVDNENLLIEKTLYDGKSYAPLEELVTYNSAFNPTYQVNNFKMFEIEIKEEAGTGNLLATYKPLKNRFYFMESIFMADLIKVLGVGRFVFPVASVAKTSYKSVVGLKYSQINQLIDRTKVHEIELALSSFDVATLDLKKVYYFSQENAYYILNSLKYVSGEKSTGEFILISRN